jgi:transcription elongation factor GreA
MHDTYKLSQAGHEKLLKEYAELKEGKRVAAVDRLAKARAMGDLSENSEYSAAREDLVFIDGRILEIEEIIRNVELVKDKKHTNVVQLGNTVVVETEGKKQELTIVGELEADIAAQKISDTSPIGKAILGSKVGDTVSVTIPAGTVKYTIVEIK